MSKLSVLGRAAVERRHGVDGPASKAVAKYDDEVKRVKDRHKRMKEGMDYGEVRLSIDDGLPFMSVLIGTKGDAWLSTDTLDAVDGMLPLVEDIKKWGPGMRYLVTEGGQYTDAAKRALDTEQKLIPARDPLTMLEEDANGLVVKAASLQDAPSSSQLRLFAEQLADLRSRFEAIDAQRERTLDLIDLAALAITDSLE